MQAFMSYSHNDERYVKQLLVHLAQLKHDGLINSWTDQEIDIGSNLDKEIIPAAEINDLCEPIVSYRLI